MTLQDEFTNATVRSQEAWISAAESFNQNLMKATDPSRIPFAPVVPVDATAAVEQWFGFAGRLLQVNHEHAKNLAGVTNAFTGAVRKHVDSVGEIVRDQAQLVSDTAKEQAVRVVETERDQARQAAHQRYEGLTKAELVEKAGERDLPKTGNVEDLIERLVDADTQR